MADAIRWWLSIEVVGLAAWPLCWRLCGNLADRGYGVSKALGLLLVSYLVWLTAALGFAYHTIGAILAAIITVAGLSHWTARRVGGDGDWLVWTRQHVRVVIASELLFLITYAGWAYFRAFDPAIAGTEKPMEFAFLNGILRSHQFPPLDPWLSGHAISYYYFGYVMLALLTRLSGVAPAVAFNLGVASWFALTSLGAFSAAYNLLAPRLAAGHHLARGRHLAAALLGPLLVAWMGNLEGVFEVLHSRGIGSPAFYRWLDVKDLAQATVSGRWLPGDNWWWWRASRVVLDRDPWGRPVGAPPIDEFPYFSFILGDLHPHVLALPFVLLAISLALNLILHSPTRGEGEDSSPEPSAVAAIRRGAASWPMGATGFVLYALALGGLSFLNTWDFPIYLGLAMLALGWRWLSTEVPMGTVARQWVLTGLSLGALGGILYWPFYLGFTSQAGGLLPNVLFPTRLHQFVLMFGSLLFIVCAWMLWLAGRTGWRAIWRRWWRWLPFTVGLPIVFAGVGAGLLWTLPSGRELIQRALAHAGPEVSGDLGTIAVQILEHRLRHLGTTLLLAAMLAWGLAALQEHHSRREARRLDRVDAFVLLLTGVGALLTLTVEWIYLRDTFGVRMNTVFKFYYQAWVLLGLSAAYGLVVLTQQMRGGLRAAFLSIAALLIAGGLVYTVAAGYSKANGFRGEPTLDGLVHIRRYSPDEAAAIDWLQATIPDAPVILEAPGGSYSSFNLISMATGLPTLLGWDGHELQWRGKRYGELAAGRPEAIDQIYRTARGPALIGLMEAWDITYIYVGPRERDRYKLTDASLARFEEALWKIYENDTVRIYRRPD